MKNRILYILALAILPTFVSCLSPMREEGRVPPLVRSKKVDAREGVVPVTSESFADSHEYAPTIIDDDEVAFVSDVHGQLDIWYVNFKDAKQSASAQLVSTSSHEKAPYIGADPEGRLRCFYVSNSGRHFQIYSGTLPKVHDQNWVVNSQGHANWPCLDASGTKLLYSVNEGDGTYDVWQRNMDDGKNCVLFEGQRGRWNPKNSNEFVYVREDNGIWAIWKHDATEATNVKLIQGESNNFDPVYSPNGEYIAFTSNRDGSSDIWVMRHDGASPQPVTTHGAVDCHPVWTQDSKSLLFSSNRAGTFDIYQVSMENILNGAPPQD